MTMPPHSPRLAGFDAVKGGAIFLVVFGHVWRGLYSNGLIPDETLFRRIDDAIYLFHMPLFFFVSGLFFSARLPLTAFLRSRILLLLWPMALWSWVDSGLRFALGIPLEGATVTLHDLLTAPLPPKGVYWFLLTLFLLNILAYFLARLPKGLAVTLGSLLALAASSGLLQPPDFDPFWWCIIYMPPYFAGLVMAQIGSAATLLRRGFLLPGAALFVLAQMALFYGVAAPLPWREIAVFAALFGALAVLAHLPKPLASLCEGLGQKTMPIYLAHIIFAAALRTLLIKLGVSDLIVHLLLGCIIGIAGPLVLLKLATKAGLAPYLGFAGAEVPRARKPSAKSF